MAARRPPLAVLLGLFLLSGATGLLYEVLWLAALSRVFGATAQAAAATLTAFFLGIAVGAFFWGRRVRRLARPLRTYGLLEIGVAAAACLGLLLEHAHQVVYGAVAETVGTGGPALLVARLLLAVALIGPASFLMGGTLPVLGEYAVRDRRTLGTRGSLLYAANTTGAVLGVLAGGFLLPPVLGYQLSYLATMALTLLVGGTALALGVFETPRPRSESPPPRRPDPRWRRLAPLALLSGFFALALQVLWTRLFSQTVQNSVQSFAAILAVYLLALALGGGLAHVLARRPWRWVPVTAVLLSASACLVALSIVVFGLASGPGRLAAGEGWSTYLGALFRTTALVVLPPVLVLGGVFPYLMRGAEARGTRPGAALGRLVGWNTIGAAIGAPIAGFVLLPAVGAETSIRLVALGYALLAVLVALGTRTVAVRAASWVVFVAAVVALVASSPASRAREGETVLDVWEGAAGTVSVVEKRGVRKLRFNGVFTLGGTHDSRWETVQTHVALLPHANAKRVFFLGMGTGITAGAALYHPVDDIVVAELVPEVVLAARTHFGPWTNGLFDPANSAKVTIIAEDGRHELAWGGAEYDVVVGDLFFPWEAGAADLYTREHFEAVKARLRPGGSFVQWLPCYQLSQEEFEAIARTMVAAFPLATLWRGDFAVERPILAVVGHREAAPLDPAVLVGNAEALPRGEIARVQPFASSLPFLLYAGNLSEAGDLLAGEPHTDDRPWIAWDAPREQRRREAGRASAFVGADLLAFEEALVEATPVDADPYLSKLDKRQRRRVRGGLALRRLAVHAAGGQWARQRNALKDLIRLVPSAERPPLDAWLE